MTVLFRSSVSGMLYENPAAAGTIDLVVVDGVEFARPTTANPLEPSEREFIVLSLALCAQLRPGFAECARNIAHNLMGSDGMFNTLRECNQNVKPQ
jgi:hypothetical protein